MLHTRHIPIWLVFAFKIYCEIRLILESDVARGYTDLVAASSRSKQLYQGQLDYRKEMGLSPNSSVKQRVDEIDCWVTNDWTGHERSDLHIKHGKSADQELYFFFRRNPILSKPMI